MLVRSHQDKKFEVSAQGTNLGAIGIKFVVSLLKSGPRSRFSNGNCQPSELA